MAYKQKKKSLGVKIMIWFSAFAMLASFLGTLLYYIGNM
jgi:hypothetical protein